MKTIEINNINYTVINPTTKQAQGIIQSMRWAKQWWDVYSRPSTTKESIREYWERELTTIGCHIWGYTGNTFNFSVYAENDDYYFCITSAHNYAVPKN